MKSAILLMCLLVGLSGCIKRSQIRAAIWLNNGLPEDLCTKDQRLWDYGFYRKLNSGKWEFYPFCQRGSNLFFGVYKDDLERILNATLPKSEASKIIRQIEAVRISQEALE